MLISAITTFIEFICIYYITKSFLHISYKPTKNDFLLLATILLLSEFILPIIPNLAWLIGHITYLLYITFILHSNKLNGLLLSCLIFELMLILQFLIATILSFTPINMNGTLVGIIGNLLTLLLAILLFRIHAFRDLYNKIIQSALPYRLVLLNSYLILFIIMLPFKMDPDLFQYNFSTILLITLILITANVCVLYYDQKMTVQKEQLLSYQKNLPIYESLINEIRNNQHEYSNRLQSLQNLSETCKDYHSLYSSLKKYTEEYSEPLHAYPLLQINMPLLAASLYNLFCRAEKNGIKVQFDVTSEHIVSQATETQLSDFTNTLLQNAVEACKPGDNIYVYITSHDNTFEFEIRNPVERTYTPDDITQFFKKGYTTKTSMKSDNIPHGIGLYNLLKSVIKLKGNVGADCITYNNKNWIIFRLRI